MHTLGSQLWRFFLSGKCQKFHQVFCSVGYIQHKSGFRSFVTTGTRVFEATTTCLPNIAVGVKFLATRPREGCIIKQRHCSARRGRQMHNGAAMADITLFLCGDVMTGRGIDQILDYSVNPILYEGNGMDACGYVQLAIDQSGPLPPKSQRGVDYIWGDAIQILQKMKPDLRVINLETAVTTSAANWPDKGIHYRMHPKNIEVIKAACIDCCVLSNNHVLDWGYPGLEETLATIKQADIKIAGAGHNSTEAMQPAVFQIPGKGRVLVFAGGHQSSGVFDKWRAGSNKAGVNLIEVHSEKSIKELQEQVKKYKKSGDIVVLSIHWGGNWGWDPDEYHKVWAHKVIDNCGIDLIHGHSSHHVKGVEVYKGKLIIYGCGDFLNDYEGISGHERYRAELALMYFPELNPSTGNLVSLLMVPTETKKLRVNRAQEEGIQWLSTTMDRECCKYDLTVRRDDDMLHLVM